MNLRYVHPDIHHRVAMCASGGADTRDRFHCLGLVRRGEVLGAPRHLNLHGLQAMFTGGPRTQHNFDSNTTRDLRITDPFVELADAGPRARNCLAIIYSRSAE